MFGLRVKFIHAYLVGGFGKDFHISILQILLFEIHSLVIFSVVEASASKSKAWSR